MKTTKKTIPALLGDPAIEREWTISIRTKYDWCEMRFSNRQHAEQEYKKIKGQGTFGGAWITELKLEEQHNESNS